jgi:hypothetical protein
MIKATLSSSTMLLEGRRIGAAYCTTKVLYVNQNIIMQKSEIFTDYHVLNRKLLFSGELCSNAIAPL